MEEELKIEEMKLEMQKKNEEKDMTGKCNAQVKHPKLVITKFEGKSLDLFRFWNQSEQEIDKVQISAVSKFSYLKEFLLSQVTDKWYDKWSSFHNGRVRESKVYFTSQV